MEVVRRDVAHIMQFIRTFIICETCGKEVLSRSHCGPQSVTFQCMYTHDPHNSGRSYSVYISRDTVPPESHEFRMIHDVPVSHWSRAIRTRYRNITSGATILASRLCCVAPYTVPLTVFKCPAHCRLASAVIVPKEKERKPSYLDLLPSPMVELVGVYLCNGNAAGDVKLHGLKPICAPCIMRLGYLTGRVGGNMHRGEAPFFDSFDDGATSHFRAKRVHTEI